MNEFGETMQKFLQYITKDQNLEDLDHVERPVMNGRRKWWRSQVLQPTVSIGRYNRSTGLIELNAGDCTDILTLSQYTTDIEANTTADYTLTCPAGHVYVVIDAFVCNESDTFQPRATFTPVSGTGAIEFGYAGAARPADSDWNLINRQGYGMVGPVIMVAGDTLLVTDQDFAAGNTVNKRFHYLDVTL